MGMSGREWEQTICRLVRPSTSTNDDSTTGSRTPSFSEDDGRSTTHSRLRFVFASAPGRPNERSRECLRYSSHEQSRVFERGRFLDGFQPTS